MGSDLQDHRTGLTSRFMNDCLTVFDNAVRCFMSMLVAI
ncbi:hypothetical Protein YC6258_05852 [Gynuella sunshinyii YC6258]|uniref:Uncharacterized protein n=1 Tax=Gynuella sunshinyii YC6258 TaxID=1445510 RepID=A0A0C5VF35_9GAMM|nr:hypothetical Protein YC6258_05852 [Gynuella sunshinyii YC6258]